MMQATAAVGRSLDVLDNFPGWAAATPFLERFIRDHGARNVADIGGGANPVLSESFVRENALTYTLFDISERELSLAPAFYRKVCVDVSAALPSFSAAVGAHRFDLVFSHMFLEHIADPLSTHRNLFSILRPGGYAVHLFPTANSIPLAANRLLPGKLTTAMLRLAQPKRDLSGRFGKFPAYYRMCGAPSPHLHRRFEALGYRVVRHTGFVGHRYYARWPALQSFEKSLRPVLVRARIPLTSMSLLILQRPPVNAAAAAVTEQ